MTTPATGPKSNLISSAMESLLTSNGSSAQVDTAAAEDWQDFLLQTMDAISGPLARHMLDRIGLLGTADDAAPLAPFRLLDHGCGLGIVASTLQKKVPSDVLQSSSIVCGDFSATLVDAVHKRIEKEGWTNCEARVVDAQDSGLPSASFTHVVANIVYHTVPDSEAALKDSIRILEPGGTLALTTWHECNPAWIVHVRDAIATFPKSLLPPDFTFHMPMQTSTWGKWYDIDWLRSTLSAPDTGLDPASVRVEPMAMSYTVDGPDHFLHGHANMVDMVASMVLGKESIERLGGRDGVRRRVREYLVSRYGENGGWTMVGVAICAWGKKR